MFMWCVALTEPLFDKSLLCYNWLLLHYIGVIMWLHSRSFRTTMRMEEKDLLRQQRVKEAKCHVNYACVGWVPEHVLTQCGGYKQHKKKTFHWKPKTKKLCVWLFNTEQKIDTAIVLILKSLRKRESERGIKEERVWQKQKARRK